MMMSRSPFTTVLAATAAALALGLAAPPSANAEEKDQEAETLRTAGEAQRYNFKTVEPGPSAIDTGGAAVYVHAPVSVAKQVVLDYRHYAKFIPSFTQSRVLSKKNGTSEVYIEVPVAHGAITIWAVMRCGPTVKDGAGEKLTCDFEKGNVAQFRAVWKLRPIDDQSSVVKLEVFVDPHLPFPPSIVTDELAYAADKGVSGVKARAESLVSPTVAKN